VPYHSSSSILVAMNFSSTLSLEMACYYHTLESKHANKEWKHCGLVTFKVVKSADSEGHHVFRNIDVCCW